MALLFNQLSVLGAPVDICKKFQFYIFRLLDLSGVPLITNHIFSFVLTGG
jgi:hypothetical protein